MNVPYQDDDTGEVMEVGSGHFMLLTGMTPTHVVFNDPAPWDEGIGRERTFTIDSFLEEWRGAGVTFFPG